MQRRAFVVGSLLASTALTPALADHKAITVIYVGGWDCGPCMRWKNNFKAEWLKSPQYAQVNYVEIDSPKLKEAYQDRFWPEKYRPIRDQLREKWGTPRFIIVKDGTVLASEWGNGDWDRAWKKIREVTA